MKPEKLITIYKIVNVLNGKTYVGQTVNMERRLREHARGKNPNAAIHLAIAKYGAESFVHEVVCVCANKKAADAVETALIDLWGTRENGYNLAPGGLGTGAGEANHRWGTKHNQKQHEALIRNNKARAGTRLSEERRKIISEQQKGRPRTPAQIAALIATNKKRAGRKATDETRAKLSVARKGKAHTAEHNAAKSEGLKKYWAAKRAAKQQLTL